MTNGLAVLRRLRKAALVVPLAAVLTLASLTGAACGGSSTPGDSGSMAPIPSGMDLSIAVYKSPTCGCCSGWEKYLRNHGFDVTSIPTDDMASVKEERGIPSDMESCHTAIIGGYFVEGHVPVEAIVQLLTEQPDVDGIALPGMPAGSPGMSGEKEAPFSVYAIKDGETSVFGEF